MYPVYRPVIYFSKHIGEPFVRIYVIPRNKFLFNFIPAYHLYNLYVKIIMKIRLWLSMSVFILMAFDSCNTLKNPFSGKRSPHEKYADAITEAGLRKTQLGILWFAAADKALTQPQLVSFPYKETGYFPAESPSAAGYIFDAKRGENIMVSMVTKPADSALFFVELWRPSSGKPTFLTVTDTLNNLLTYTVKKDGQFIVRIQPQLLRSIEYTIVINKSPSLAFPVANSGNPKIISFWGAGRDNGTRKHEGVDISANFRTPALAAADGITRVSENSLGGKVVFLTDDNTGYSLYYAHLDSQIAHNGQRVKTGDVIGLVGKTGNAQHTIPHLHFGVYTIGGAIDPIAFIDPYIKEPQAVRASIKKFNTWQRSVAVANIYKTADAKSNITSKVLKGEALRVIAATGDYYKIESPGGLEGFINSNMVTDKKLREENIKTPIKLLEVPNMAAPSKTTIASNHTIEVMGTYKNFILVRENNLQGWIMTE